MTDKFPVSLCIVDDDADFVSFLSRYLEARNCKVMAFDSAEAFLESPPALAQQFFLVDLTLPGADGVDLISMIRTHGNAGIIVISGRMGPDAFSSALAAGADMFINKPVRFDQVYQAILSVTRRIGAARVVAGNWTYDDRFGVLRSPSAQIVRLSKTEQKLLTALLAADGRPLDRQALSQAGGITSSKDDRNLDAAMFRMRRRIEQSTREAAPLRTIHGSGYLATGIERAAVDSFGG